MVYPVGQTQGIDPMYGEHVHNIPYPMPAKPAEPTDPRFGTGDVRKKSTSWDPGWIRTPQVLLVEDDPTCRRIGSKFLHAFHCKIDSAVSLSSQLMMYCRLTKTARRSRGREQDECRVQVRSGSYGHHHA